MPRCHRPAASRWRRRIVALIAALARSGRLVPARRGDGWASRRAVGRPARRAVESAWASRMADQVMLLGFSGTPPAAPSSTSCARTSSAASSSARSTGPIAPRARSSSPGCAAPASAGPGPPADRHPAGGRSLPLVRGPAPGGERARGGARSAPRPWPSAGRATRRRRSEGPASTSTSSRSPTSTTPASPLGDRAFGANPDLVAALTAASIRGLREGAGSPARPSTSPGWARRRRTPTRGPRPSGSTPRRWPTATGAVPGGVRCRRAGGGALARLLRGLRPGDAGALTTGRDGPPAGPARLRRRRDHRRPRGRGDPATESVPEAAVEAIAAGCRHGPDRRSGRYQRGVRAALMRAVATGAIPAAPGRRRSRVLELKRRSASCGQPR